MRTNKFFLGMAAFAAIAITSCGNDDNDGLIDDGRVYFTSGVTATSTSRVSGDDGTTWDSGDKIGIFMVDHSSPYSIAESAENIEYTTTGGTTASFTGTDPIYYPVTTPEKVDFIAYYPYASLTNTYTYTVNVVTQTSQSAIDLMWAKATNNGSGYDKTQGTNAVNFTFAHKLAKVVINVNAGTGVTSLTGLTVSMAGMKTAATFDVSAGTLNDDATNVQAITPYKAATAESYEAILLPVTLDADDHIVTFAIGGDNYKWTMTDNNEGATPVTALEAGKKYTFTITLNKTGVVVEGAISEWRDGGTITGTTQ